MLLCVCSVIDHRRHQNAVKTLVTPSTITLSTTFLFLPGFHIICEISLHKNAQGNTESTR